MWVIIKPDGGNGELLSSGWTSNDELETFFSLYRSPNEVIWKIKEPSVTIAGKLNYGNIVRLICFKKNITSIMPKQSNDEDVMKLIKNYISSAVIDIHLSVESKNWYQGKRKKDTGLEIVMIPYAKSILKNNSSFFFYGGKKYDKRYYLGDIFAKIEKESKNKFFIRSDTVTKNIEYKNFISFSNPLDTIDKIADDNELEYFYTSNELHLTKMVSGIGKVKKGSLKYYYPAGKDFVNTTFTSKIDYIDKDGIKREGSIVSGGFPDILPLPGTEINLLDEPKRILYLNLHFGKGGNYSIFVSIHGPSVPREKLYSLMPEKGKERLNREYAYKYPSVLYGDIKGYTEKDFKHESIRRYVNIDLTYSRHDVENMDFQNAKESPIMFESVPYAGAEVGLQFPKNIGGKIIAVAPEGKYESSTIVGQIFQENKMPKRGNILDYRLTLGGAATQYYDHSALTRWDITKKRIILGVTDKITHEKIPGTTTPPATALPLTDLKSYIQIGDTSDEGAEKIVIRVGNQTITLNGTTMVIDNGSGNRKITISAGGSGTVDVT